MSKRITSLILLMIIVIAGNLGYVNWRMQQYRVRMNTIEYQSYGRDMQLHQGIQYVQGEFEGQFDSVQQAQEELCKQLDAQLDAHEEQIPQLVEQLMPSVVAIYAEHAWIRNPHTGEMARMSASGVVVSNTGMILTAAHVADLDLKDFRRFWVVFEDGTERDIDKIAYVGNLNPDVGVVFIDPNGLDLEPVESKDWDRIAVQGEKVLVLGTPMGERHSVSTGIVSHANRTTSGPGGESLFVQIDAPINGGNSGGPVFDMEGKLLGIVSWGYNNSDGLSFIVSVEKIWEGLTLCNTPVEVKLVGAQ